MIKSIELFKYALEKKDKKIFDSISKADLHNHALLGSNRKEFKKRYPNIKLEHFENSNSITSLSTFIKNNIIDISTTKEGQLSLFECTILTAINDGIAKIEMDIDYRLLFEVYDNQYEDFKNDLLSLKNKYKEKIKIGFDLGISRNAYNPSHKKAILELINKNIFSGLDIYGDEFAKPINEFKKIYRYAEKKHLKLKAHVGEFGCAKDVYIAIKNLHLNVVQHGISIIDNPHIVKYAKKKKIQFNVCPTSNIKLGRVKNIKEHPIKKMFKYGLKVTINTDDQLIFENSLYDEFLLLYTNNVFTIEELNIIRENAL